MDENNTYINKSEKEALEIMENVSDITPINCRHLERMRNAFRPAVILQKL